MGMRYYYDKTQKAFLVVGIHRIPDDAIAVSDEDYQTLIDGRAQGCEIIVSTNNKLTLTTPKPTPMHNWDGKNWVLNDSAKFELITKQKAQIRQAINIKRDEIDASGVFVESLGKWLDSDSKAYQNILGVKASFDFFGDITVDWTWADNSNSTISKQDLAAMIGALLQAKQTNHDNAIKHKQAVMQSQNPLEYDYSSGWTKTYADFVKEQSNG